MGLLQCRFAAATDENKAPKIHFLQNFLYLQNMKKPVFCIPQRFHTKLFKKLDLSFNKDH